MKKKKIILICTILTILIFIIVILIKINNRTSEWTEEDKYGDIMYFIEEEDYVQANSMLEDTTGEKFEELKDVVSDVLEDKWQGEYRPISQEKMASDYNMVKVDSSNMNIQDIFIVPYIDISEMKKYYEIINYSSGGYMTAAKDKVEEENGIFYFEEERGAGLDKNKITILLDNDIVTVSWETSIYSVSINKNKYEITDVITYKKSTSDITYYQKDYAKNNLKRYKFGYDDNRYSTNKASKENNPYIGMKYADIDNTSWGKHDHLNITETDYGTHIQVVYSNYKYLYFENDICTGIQYSD